MRHVRRVMMLTINADHPQRGMVHAFEGVFGKENVLNFDYLGRLRQTNWAVEMVNDEVRDGAVGFRPDWMWLQLQNTCVVAASTLARVREALPACVMSNWAGDVRAEVGDYQRSVCAATHMTLVPSRGQDAMFLKAGAPEVRYLQLGLDWEEDVLGLPDWEPPFQVPNVVFAGNNYGDRLPGTKEREALVAALSTAKAVGFGVVGSGWEGKGRVAGKCGVKQQVHVFRRAKVVVSCNHFPDLAGYYSDRHLCALASGTPLVCRRIPMLDAEFRDGEHLLTYATEQEAVEKVRALLSDEALRRRIGAAGRAEAIRSHTWFSRILSVLPRVEEVLSGLCAP